MGDIINFAVTNADAIFGATTAVLAAALAIVKLTPTPKDDEVVGKVMEIAQKVAGFLKPKA